MNKGGRPSEYDPNFVKEVDKYLEEAIPENMDLPSIEGLALRLDVSKQSLYNWAEQHPKFLDALEKLRLTQKQHLVKIGIFGGKEINSNIVSLMLKVNHDMVETNRTELTGKDGSPLGVVELPMTYDETGNNMDSPQGTADGSTQEN